MQPLNSMARAGLFIGTVRRQQCQCVRLAPSRCGKATLCCSCKETRKLMAKILVRILLYQSTRVLLRSVLCNCLF